MRGCVQMNSSTAKVSIVVPVHNRASELAEALESIRAQTYPHWEAIVVDDRSTDNAPSVIARYASEDARFRFVKLPRDRQGAPAARNCGAALAGGQFVIFFDSDDLLAPAALANRVAVMNAHPELDFAVFGCHMFRKVPGDTGLMWNADTGGDDLDRFLSGDVPWQTTGPIWRRASLERVGPWDELALSSQDWEFHIRALVSGLKYDRFRPPDIYWRMAAPDRASIGKSQSIEADYHRSRFDLYVRLLSLVRDAGLLTEARKQWFAGLIFRACEKLHGFVSAIEARKAWRVARGRKLVTQRQFIEGWWVLMNMRWPERGKAARDKLESRWPERMLLPASTTFMKTPATESLAHASAAGATA